MILRIYPKIKHLEVKNINALNVTEYVIFGSDEKFNKTSYSRTLIGVPGVGEAFVRTFNIKTDKVNQHFLGIPTDQFNWRYHGKRIFDPVESDHTFYRPGIENFRGIEFNIVTFSSSLAYLGSFKDIGYGIGCDKKWADELINNKKLTDIEGPLFGGKYLISDEYFLAGEVEEDCGYTEGYKMGYTGLRWL